ncbi:MAG: hypothetical protein COU22_01495, partial [Candidatus Komeilibacteria bacterium CG10_big_fil_rev_8_21_14_0_10_41_13]
MRLGYDSSNYTSFTTGSTGDLTIAPSGGDTNITGNLTVSGTQTFTGASSLATTTIMATGTNPVLTVRQGGTGDIVQFKDGNNIVMKILDGGNVGIGTTTPYSVLSVSTLAQAAPTTKLLTVASTTGQTLLTVLGDGNVGIGTSTPNRPLDIYASGSTGLRITDGAADQGIYLLDVEGGFYPTIRVNGTGGANAGIEIQRSDARRYIGTFLVDASSGELGNGSGDWYTGIPYGYPSYKYDYIIGSGSNSYTLSGARLLITTSGKVGIGTTTPYSVLSVSTSTQSAPSTKLFTVASTTGASILRVLGSG